MTAFRFHEARLLCLLSIPAAAQLLRVSERTVHNWERGRVTIPYAAYKLMRILRGYELPGDDWKGYRLVGDTLWSPEGLAFKASQQRWWSLTCRMANEFRVIHASQRALTERMAASAASVGEMPAQSLAFTISPVLRSRQAPVACVSPGAGVISAIDPPHPDGDGRLRVYGAPSSNTGCNSLGKSSLVLGAEA